MITLWLPDNIGSLDRLPSWVDEKMEFSVTFYPLSDTIRLVLRGKLKMQNTIKHILGAGAGLPIYCHFNKMKMR